MGIYVKVKKDENYLFKEIKKKLEARKNAETDRYTREVQDNRSLEAEIKRKAYTRNVKTEARGEEEAETVS